MMIEQWTEFKAGMFRSKNVNEPLRIAPYAHFDPFQNTYPCWTRIPVSTIALIKFMEWSKA